MDNLPAQCDLLFHISAYIQEITIVNAYFSNPVDDIALASQILTGGDDTEPHKS